MRRNHALWLGPLVAFAGAVSYFILFARFAPLRDVPWVNLPLVLAGLALSGLGLVVAWRRGGLWRRLTGGAGLAVSLALAALFCAYVFVFSYALPAPAARTLELDRAPEFILDDHAGRPVSLADLRGRKVVLVFYRGFW